MPVDSHRPASAFMHYAVFTMVGPGDVDARRFRTLLTGLFRYEPAVPLLVVVNDTGGTLPAVKDLIPAGCEFVELSKTRRPSIHEIARNTLAVLRYLAERPELSFAVKLDTDALVIGPFADAIGRYFDAHQDVGEIGRADRSCDGSAVDFGIYVPFVRRLKRRIQVWRSPRWGVAQAFFGVHACARRLVRRAARNGVDSGLHCQGGSYALSSLALRRLRDQGLIRDDRPARVFGLAEDLMVSTLVGATGLRIVSQTAPGEPFGVAETGLPFLPEELAAKGYAIIHSVKNDKRVTEQDIVRFFEVRDGRK